MNTDSADRPVAEVARLFLRLGVVAFGGPAAHIAMMRDEVVDRRRWLTDQQFLDLLGVTNLIPGPNSTEMAIHLGFIRAGWRGLLAAGTLFILPAFAIVLGLAVAYDRWGTTPGGEHLLYGIKPVVIAIIAQAIWRLGLPALRPAPWLAVFGIAVAALYLAGLNEILLLLAGGLLIALVRNGGRAMRTARGLPALLPLPLVVAMPALQAAERTMREYDHTTLFLTFLKIGAILYGSGYVLVAFVEADFVENLGWLTEQQLLDAVAIGQVTPGPVFTTATFVGYITGGFPGAILATVAIFLPSFIFVAILNPLIPRLRRSAIASALVDGVNVSALGLMAGVMIELGGSAIVDVPAGLALAAAATALFVFRTNTTWIVLGGALFGLAWRGS